MESIGTAPLGLSGNENGINVVPIPEVTFVYIADVFETDYVISTIVEFNGVNDIESLSMYSYPKLE